MKISELHGVLAVGTGDTGKDGATSFLTSDIGAVAVKICGVIGIVIVIVCIIRMVRSVTMGRPGEGFKILFWGLIVGGLLFNLNITVSATGYMSGLIKTLFDSAQSITG